ncbi:hypothetical protein HDV01_000902 [Terramyces sp. JEL0728]|nr:hypothetical protein HDV01_000902 [Terramyces sp. JEL0728]
MIFNSRRSTVYSTKAIVSATQPLAVQCGIEVLRQGGNAADAAVAVAAGLNVTEPSSTGIGGDLFCLYFDAKTQKVHSLNATGKSAQAVTLEKVKTKVGDASHIPFDNVLAVNVPGAAAGWVDMHEIFGSKAVTLQQILQPAIALARDGFAISEISAKKWQDKVELLKRNMPGAKEFLPNGNAPKEGDLVFLPGLAKTFESVAKHGKAGFYSGEIGAAIIEAVQSRGGLLTLEDLESHGNIIGESIYAPFRHLMGEFIIDISIVALMVLQILESLENQGRIPKLESMQHNSVDYIHVIVEALKLAFADAQWYVTDPQKYNVPTKGLLSPEYLTSQSHLIDMKNVLKEYNHGQPPSSGNTVYFSVVDKDGNACSVVNSTYSPFGSGIIVPGTGINLHSRGANFSLDPASPNVIEGGKRPYHTIIDKQGNRIFGNELWGAFMQPQGHVQVLLNHYIYEMQVQQALDAPRFCFEVSSGELLLEDGISESVKKELEAKGHRVRIVTGHDRAVFGRGQIIKNIQTENGFVLAGGSDPRGDGHAVPML